MMAVMRCDGYVPLTSKCDKNRTRDVICVSEYVRNGIFTKGRIFSDAYVRKLYVSESPVGYKMLHRKRVMFCDRPVRVRHFGQELP